MELKSWEADNKGVISHSPNHSRCCVAIVVAVRICRVENDSSSLFLGFC